MSKRGVDQKPSLTAMMAALRRALAHQEFDDKRFGPDDLARVFLPPYIRFLIKFKGIRAKINNKLNRFLPGMRQYLIARTIYFDQVFTEALKRNIPQIVLLGAGYDTRPYRFAELNQTTRIIELDAATTQNRKRTCLAKARLDVPSNVRLVPIDFDRESLPDVLAGAGYDPQENTLFLWEGVCYYLDPESVDRTLEFVGRAPGGGRTVVFDYAVSIPEENVNNYFGVAELIRAMNQHHPDERFRFLVDDGGIESFLDKRGLKMTDHLDNREIERKFLMDDNGSLLGQITGWFRFVAASTHGNPR